MSLFAVGIAEGETPKLHFQGKKYNPFLDENLGKKIMNSSMEALISVLRVLVRLKVTTSKKALSA